MPQPPVLTDVLQIEPGSGDTLTVSRDATTGALRLVDAVLTSGVLLPTLVGLRAITGVYVVGRAGDGAAYTSVQDALDAVPTTSSAVNPSLILVMPGRYVGNVTIERDGVFIMAPGGATLVNDGNSDTVQIKASLDATPQDVLLRGLTIENDRASRACVRLIGADSFASGTVTIDTVPLAVGDTITINGTNLTGVIGSRTSGANDFSVASMDPTVVAAEIVDAINDPANAFASLVSASSVGAVATVDAITAGAGGNSITLAASVTLPGAVTLSGATLSGGGAAGSLMASGEALLDNCWLQATDPAGFVLHADTVNNVRVQGGTFKGSHPLSSVVAINVASLRIFGVERATAFALSYDSSAGQPSTTNSIYSIANCGPVGTITANLVDVSNLYLFNNYLVGNITFGGGSQGLYAWDCSVGDLTLSDSVGVQLNRSERGALVLAGGTPTLEESQRIDSLTFTASVSEAYTFGIAQPDTAYTVLLESPDPSVSLAVTNKTVNGFDVESSLALTGSVGLSIIRKV